MCVGVIEGLGLVLRVLFRRGRAFGSSVLLSWVGELFVRRFFIKGRDLVSVYFTGLVFFRGRFFERRDGFEVFRGFWEWFVLSCVRVRDVCWVV